MSSFNFVEAILFSSEHFCLFQMHFALSIFFLIAFFLFEDIFEKISLSVMYIFKCLFSFPGYGHIYPTTQTGRALTIVYAIVGIPLFLIALTDFGKLFTRAIKFLWSFVRRCYYTGSCRSVRKNAQVSVSILDYYGTNLFFKEIIGENINVIVKEAIVVHL